MSEVRRLVLLGVLTSCGADAGVVVERAPIVDTAPIVVIEDPPPDAGIPACWTATAHVLVRGAALFAFRVQADAPEAPTGTLCDAVRQHTGPASSTMTCVRAACEGSTPGSGCEAAEPMLAFAAAERSLAEGTAIRRGRWRPKTDQREALARFVRAFRATTCDEPGQACVDLSNDVLWVERCLDAVRR